MSASGLYGDIGGERTLYLGPRVPNHIKNLSKALTSINKSTFRSLLKLALADLEGKEVTPEMYQAIKDSCPDSSSIDSIYSAIFILLQSAVRLPESSLKQEVFKDDLQEIKIPEDYITDIANIVYGPRRSAIDENSIKTAPHLPHLEKFRWRVDVTISTSSLNRVLEPCVLMEMAKSNGEKETFEVQPSQFHQLRYAVANLLKEVEHLEKKNVIKMN